MTLCNFFVVVLEFFPNDHVNDSHLFIFIINLFFSFFFLSLNLIYYQNKNDDDTFRTGFSVTNNFFIFILEFQVF